MNILFNYMMDLEVRADYMDEMNELNDDVRQCAACGDYMDSEMFDDSVGYTDVCLDCFEDIRNDYEVFTR